MTPPLIPSHYFGMKIFVSFTQMQLYLYCLKNAQKVPFSVYACSSCEIK